MEITERGARDNGLRGRLIAFDPYDLIRIMPAEGMIIKYTLHFEGVFYENGSLYLSKW
jgi:hypothetical protein